MRRLFVAAIIAVIALAVVSAMLIPTPAGTCPENKGKGKQIACDVVPPPPCPPCMEFGYCRCECVKIPGCKYDVLEPPDTVPGS